MTTEMYTFKYDKEAPISTVVWGNIPQVNTQNTACEALQAHG